MTDNWDGYPPQEWRGKNGWHRLRAPTGVVLVFEWLAAPGEWYFGTGTHYRKPEEFSNLRWSYVGPLITPEEATNTNRWNGKPPSEHRSRDGCHWVEHVKEPVRWVASWDAQRQTWHGIPTELMAVCYRYICPCPAPAELTKMREEIDYLRAAIDDTQIVCEIPPLPVTDYNSAREAIRNAIAWHMRVALDPAVSEDAREFQAAVRFEALREAARIADAHVEKWRSNSLSAANEAQVRAASVMAHAAENIAADIRTLIKKEKLDNDKQENRRV